MGVEGHRELRAFGRRGTVVMRVFASLVLVTAVASVAVSGQAAHADEMTCPSLKGGFGGSSVVKSVRSDTQVDGSCAEHLDGADTTAAMNSGESTVEFMYLITDGGPDDILTDFAGSHALVRLGNDNTIFPITGATCSGANITINPGGSAPNLVVFSFPNPGDSCALTVTASDGTTNLTFSGSTLSRRSGSPGRTYDASPGVVTGGLFRRPEPTNHPTDFQATANSGSQITTTWTDAAAGSQAPDSYLVMCNTTGTFADPVDLTAQADDTSCGDGSGVQNIAHGGGSTATWTGLTEGTQYFYKIFPYTNTDIRVDYKTDDVPLTANATTPDTTGPTVTISAPARVTGPFEATFTFNEDVSGFDDATDITVGNGTPTAPAGGPRVYTATITPVVGPGPTTSITINVGAGVAQDGATNPNTAAVQVTVIFVTEALVQTRTRSIIHNFMANRGDQITANDYDFSRRANRGNGGGSGGPVNFSGEGDLSEQKMTFGTSLRQVLGARDVKKRQRLGDLAQGLGVGDQSIYGGSGPATGVDIWMRGHWSRYDNDDTSGDFGLVFIGADYRFENGLVLGFVTSIDWTREENNTDDYKADGRGWLAGPYVVANITDNLVFDGRIAWGQADNHVSPFNTYEDSFDSERWLISGKLTGSFRAGGNVLIQPHVGIIYFEEEQDSYTDSTGTAIASQTVELGRMTFGPKVSTSYTTGAGTVVAPYVAVEGIWDFETADRLDITTGLAAASGNEDFRGRVEGGFDVGFTDGVRLTGEGFYDGIGADEYSSYGASVNLRLPLQYESDTPAALRPLSVNGDATAAAAGTEGGAPAAKKPADRTQAPDLSSYGDKMQ